MRGKLRVKWKRWFPLSIRDGAVSLGIMLATTVLCVLLRQIDEGDEFTSMLFILAVFLVSRFTSGYFFGIAASFISVLAVNFAFTYPYFAFNFSLSGYPMAVLCMLVVAVVTSAMTSRFKLMGQLKLEAEKEKTRGNLLRAVSHDLRTPLTSILGASSALLENEQAMDQADRQRMLSGIQEDANWLIRMVENLLSVTRITSEEGARIVKTPQAAEEVAADAVQKFRKVFPDFSVTVDVPEALLLVPMDPMLIGQVLTNLMENAARHAAGATRVALRVWADGGCAVFEVSDDGAGIEESRLAGLFGGSAARSELHGDTRRDMGIGLSVCDTIVTAHGGTIAARNQRGGGAVFLFTLPLEEKTHE